MTLTTLTKDDEANKSLLCSMKDSLRAMVGLLRSPNEDLRHQAAGVLSNLSWKTSATNMQALRDVKTVRALTLAAMGASREMTLNGILSALWNMSAHCMESKADICAVEGALAFLVTCLTFRSPSKTFAILENSGGILRNISSHIAASERYRKILRQHGCFQILLHHLKSPSVTVVSNACGTLWNLSAGCSEDQKALWEMGIASMMRQLVNSKHQIIATVCASTLKNLLDALESDQDHVGNDSLITAHKHEPRDDVDKDLKTASDHNVTQTCRNLVDLSHHPQKNSNFNSSYRPITNNIEHYKGLQHISGARLPHDHENDLRNTSVDHNLGVTPSQYPQDKPVDLREKSVQQDRNVHVGYTNVSYPDRSPACITASDQRGQSLYDQKNHSNVKFPTSSVSQNTERRKLRGHNVNTHHLDHPEQDQPIDYSMKYPSEPLRRQPKPTAFARPMPRHPNHHGAEMSTPHAMEHPNQGVNRTMEASPGYSGYAETDLDHGHIDQPTDFSMRYVEPDEQVNTDEPINYSVDQPVSSSVHGEQAINYSIHQTEQPINYSSRFEEREASSHSGLLPSHSGLLPSHSGLLPSHSGLLPSHSGLLPSHSGLLPSHSRLLTQPAVLTRNQALIEDDSLQSFCTEGTPLTFLSTATSLSDLSGKAEKGDNSEPTTEEDDRSSPENLSQNNQLNRYSDCEMMSGTGTHSSTGYTVITRNQAGDVLGPSSSWRPPREAPAARPTVSDPPSLYSYNDTTNTSSPSDRMRSYCTEDTPYSFSRRSSLSSLHSTDVAEAKQTVQELDADEMDMSSADVTLKPELLENPCDSTDTSANTSHGAAGKSVTFDVHDTPMMFSRCSSLGSLSSFDAYSVHSSVHSEYSRRASEVVSPSDLPDSPSDTMPPSPSRSKSPTRFTDTAPHQRPRDDRHMRLDTIPERGEVSRSAARGSQNMFKDIIQEFADEGSPNDDNFSCATSLSALTFDDEPVIRKDPGLRRVPVGQETDPVTSSALSSQLRGSNQNIHDVSSKKEEATLDSSDGDDNSSVSEGEEDFLENFIRIAMPTKLPSSKKKKKKSTVDDVTKQKTPMLPCKTPTAYPKIPAVESLVGDNRCMPTPTKPVARIQGILMKQEEMLDVCDSPRKFATEGTPLNYSRAESLSDISMDSNDGTGIDKTMDTVIDVQARKRAKAAEKLHYQDDHSDVSSISDDEDLLCEAIEAAMPKSDKKRKSATKTSKKTPMSKAKEQMTQHNRVTVSSHIPHVEDTKLISPYIMDGDCVQTFAVEDTPLSLSHATSLSDLTVAEMPHTRGHQQDIGFSARTTDRLSDQYPHGVQEPSVPEAENSLDSMKVFGMEGTPMMFSRNDSLSSLSCDEEDLPRGKTCFADEVGKVEPQKHKKLTRKSRTTSPRRVDMENDAISRLKTPGKPLPFHGYGPSSTSTPLTKKSASPVVVQPVEEEPRTFVTEDTPMCFSRNSSLSSLDSRDHEITCVRQQNHLEIDPIGGGAHFKVEDTPANFSRDSSLSVLSVESLSFDATPSEGDLLEECINAALPKSRQKGSASHSTESTSNRKTARTMLFSGPTSTDDEKTAGFHQAKHAGDDHVKTDTGVESTTVSIEPTVKAHCERMQHKEGPECLQDMKKADDQLYSGDDSDLGIECEEDAVAMTDCDDSTSGELDDQTNEMTNLHSSTNLQNLGAVNGGCDGNTQELVDSVSTEPEVQSSPEARASNLTDVQSVGEQESADTTVSSIVADTTVITVINANDTIVRSNLTDDSLLEDSSDHDDLSVTDQCPSAQHDTIPEDADELSTRKAKAVDKDVMTSVLTTKRELSNSSLCADEVMEHKSLSAISIDYANTHDTISEASVSLSSTSLTQPGLTSAVMNFNHLSHENVKCDIIEFKATSEPIICTIDTDPPKHTKKPTSSKIAGLWRKDQKKTHDGGPSAKEKRLDSIESSIGSIRKLFKLGKSKKEKQKENVSSDDLLNGASRGGPESDKQPLESRSQAYGDFSSADNLSMSRRDITQDDGQQQRLWKSSHAIDTTVDDLSFGTLSFCDGEEAAKTLKAKKHKRRSLHIFKRPPHDEDQHDISNISKMAPPKKKGFSFRRRDAKSKLTNSGESPDNCDNNKENEVGKTSSYLVTAV